MKLKLKIMNIIYLALSAAAVIFYAINPFFKASVSGDLTADSLRVVVDDSQLESFGITVDDLFSEKDSIPVKVELTIDNQMLIDVWKTDDAISFVNDNVVSPNVDAIVKELEPALNTIAKSAAKGAIRSTIEDKLSESLGEGEDLYAKLEESGHTKEEVEESINKVTNVLLSDEPQTIDSVSQALSEEYNKYASSLGGTEMTPEELKEQIQGSFEELGLVDEEGNITDINSAIAALIGGMLGGESDAPKGNEGSPEETFVRKLFKPIFEAEDNGEENPLAAKLTEVINEKINDDVKKNIALGMKAAGGLLVLFLLGWVLKALQVILCFFFKKPYLRTEIFGIIGGIISIVLLAVTAIFFVASKIDLSALKDLPMIGDIVKKIPAGLQASLVFSSTIPAILYLVDCVYSIFYKITKRRFKRKYKNGEIE